MDLCLFLTSLTLRGEWDDGHQNDDGKEQQHGGRQTWKATRR